MTASVAAADVTREEELIGRILASRYFTKAPLLSAFLNYICQRTLQDGAPRISEHEIGVSVFGREQGYDSREDNIVRNYARQLRKRLDEYYATDGRTETLRVDIPKGGYVPVFTPQRDTAPNGSRTQPSSVEERSPNWIDGLPVIKETRRPLLSVIPLLTVVGVLLAGMILILHSRSHHPEIAPREFSKLHPVWEQLFFPDKDTLVVPSDTALVMLEDMKGKRFSLAEYASWSSIEQPEPSFISDLKTRKYTSVVDLEIVSRIERLPEVYPDRLAVRAARSLTIDDLNGRNLILLGSVYSIPWIEVFQNKLSFEFNYKPAESRFWIRDRNPAPDEATTYTNHWNGLSEKAYAVIAFIPNLNRTGHVLLVQGLDGAGTEAAENLLFHGEGADAILNKARRPDGSLGNFEALIESTSVDSHATSTRVVAVRIPN